jgi:hypothetical protein
MSDNSLNPLRVDHAADAYLGDEPPDLSALRAVAEHAEIADAVSGLADGYGLSLSADDPLAPLPMTLLVHSSRPGSRCIIARRTIHCTGLAGCACCRSPTATTRTARQGSWCPGQLTICYRSTGIAGASITAHTRS